MYKTLLSLCIQQPDGSNECITPPASVPNPGNGVDFQHIFTISVIAFIIISVVVALFFLIWAGIKWILSGGDKQKVQQARQQIIYVLIGLFIIFFSFFIVNILGHFFGVNLFNGNEF